jgi:CubicO group peptidase (beta-lactamase class C family)
VAFDAQAARSAGFSPARLERIGAFLTREYLAPGKIAGCQVLVARHGQVAYQTSLGAMDLAREKPMRDDALFRIYSMTKPITSVALMQLFEQGRFQLHDPIANVIPAFRELKVYVSGRGESMVTRAPERPLTFRDLLSHTGGLSYAGFPVQSDTLHPVDEMYRELKIGSRKDDLEAFVHKLAHVPLRFSPGERWLYSYSVDVSGYLVERLSGQRFDRYLHEHILTPLGMRDTAFALDPNKVERLCVCYARDANKQLRVHDDPQRSEYAREPTFYAGGHGLLSTLADYHRFCEMLRRGGELEGARILGSRTLALMTQNYLPGGQDLTQLAIGAFSETGNEGIGFGLGFATTLSAAAAGTYGAGDFFWGGLASTLFWVDPREDLVAIFLTQLIPSSTYNFRGPLKSLVYGALED